MLNLKKVIALVCVFALALSTVAFGATYTDVAEDSAYYEAVETLNKLEIVTGYEDGTYKPEAGVTRAEMAALIARIQGYGETAKGSANTGFTDVPASHWASGYIANAAGMGIINGYGDGTFGPEDPVLYEQAVKMIMATLGYTPYAEHNGGYPTGYLAAAQRYDVSLNVANAAVGSQANRGTVAQLLAQAIDTPLMIQNSWSTSGEVTYVICDGQDKANDYTYKTLMSENLGYVKVRGILADAGLVTIAAEGAKTFDVTDDAAVGMLVKDSYSTNNKDFNGIKGNDASTWASKKLLVGTTDAADYLGRSVVGYIKKLATDDYELVSIAVDTNRDDVLVIDLDSYNKVNASNNIEYYKDGDSDTTEIICEASMAVVYNNQCLKDGATANEGTAAIASLITPTPFKYGGTITFIDNDDVKGYDVAIIEAAATAVVKKVTEDGIAFKKGITLPNTNTMSMLEIDAEDENKVVAIMKDGEMVEAASLNEWDVLSIIAVKENANVIVAEVVTNEVVGMIASRKASDTSATSYAYKIADNWYDVATSAYKATAAELEVGIGGTFYIDKYGKIAAFDEDTALAGGAVANYAYVVGVDAEPASFGSKGIEAKMQVVTADGVEVLAVKNNAKVKGSSDFDLANWADTDANDKFDGTDAGFSTYSTIKTAVEGKVVKYSKNSAGQISEIVLAGYDTEKFDTMTVTPGMYEFDADNNRFHGAGYIDEDAIVFMIGGLAGGTDSIEDSKVGTLADFDHENDYKVIAKYCDSKAEDCNIIVIDAESMKSSTTSGVAVITAYGDGVNEDGEDIYILSYYIDGALVEDVATIAKSDLTIAGSGLSIGDIVKVKVGSDNLISDIKVVWDFTNAKVRPAYDTAVATLVSESAVADKEIFAGGVVTGFKESSTLAKITTTYSDAADNTATEYKLSQAENVYVIDGTGNVVSVKVGSDASFKIFEKLYDGTTNVDVNTDDDDAIEISGASVATAQAYADHVYVRAYDGKVKDVVIVKTAKDVKIK